MKTLTPGAVCACGQTAVAIHLNSPACARCIEIELRGYHKNAGGDGRGANKTKRVKR